MISCCFCCFLMLHLQHKILCAGLQTAFKATVSLVISALCSSIHIFYSWRRTTPSSMAEAASSALEARLRRRAAQAQRYALERDAIEAEETELRAPSSGDIRVERLTEAYEAQRPQHHRQPLKKSYFCVFEADFLKQKYWFFDFYFHFFFATKC